MTSALEPKLLRGLYAITETSNLSSTLLIQQVQSALQGGAKLIQYRDKSGNSAKRLKEVLQLKMLCQQHSARLIVNDDLELATLCKADGLHLGQTDTPLQQARERLGSNIIIGLSCYNDFQRALHAQKQGADYIAFGSFYPSLTKPGAIKADIQLIKRAKQELQIAVCAIGGITLENAPPLLEAGADILAVISAVFQANNIQQTAQHFSDLFSNH